METLRQWFNEFESEYGPIIGVTTAEERGCPLRHGLDEVPVDVLDREFDTGYGGSGVRGTYAWSDTHVMFIVVYDGATWWAAIPRNPSSVHPQLHGGE